jgi:crotonobetainyl-CoA:carnitine CoA-transferase CaiB-like acyl-CoA transferase
MLPATLDDLKVLDLSQGLAGPVCAKILADFGADVVKVEPLKGDAARNMAPFFGNAPHPEKASCIHWRTSTSAASKSISRTPRGAL